MAGEVPFSGRLREVHLSSILHLLQRRRLTGILRVRLNDLDKSLYIKEGEIIFATSKYPDDRLGLLLLKTGKLTYAQFETVVRIYEASVLTSNKSGLRQGTILVDQGFLTPKELYDAVIVQVKEIILGLFTWIDGEYEFSEGPLPSQEVITLKISTAALILEGVRRVTDWTWLAGGLPPFTCRLRLTKDPRDLFQLILMQPNEVALLGRLNGQTIRELLVGSPLSALDTLRLIYFFLSAGFAEAAKASDAPASSFEERESITQQIIVEEIGATIHRNEADSSPNIAQIRESYQKMGAQNYYELLGVPMYATREEIKRIYYRLAKIYHPDRHFEESMQEVKKELEALFAKIKEAYDVLNSDPKRAAYNENLSKPQKSAVSKPFDIAKQAEASFLKGKEAYEAKDYKRAVDLFETSARLVPENHLYFGYLGKALLHLPERIRRAEMAFRQALMLNPNEVDYYAELARIYEGQGLIRRAVKEYEEALKRAPDHAALKEALFRLKAKV
jgi:curved DNA-binding protein CbpA